MNKTTKGRITSTLITGGITIILAVFTAGFTSSRRSGVFEEKTINNEKAIERLDAAKAPNISVDRNYDAILELKSEISDLNKYVREND